MGSHTTERDEFAVALLKQVDAIRRIGRKRLRDRDALDDFTQETLARAYSGRARLRDAQRLPNWVAGIARNVARRWERLVSAVESVSDESSPDPSPLERLEGDERRQALLDALDSLSPSERALILAHYLDGESYAKLAERHRLSRSAVGVQLHRARRKLWRRLAALMASFTAVVGGFRRAAGGILMLKTGTKVGIVTVAVLGVALTVGVAVRKDLFETRSDANETEAVEKSSSAENPAIRGTTASDDAQPPSRESETTIPPTSIAGQTETTKLNSSVEKVTAKPTPAPSQEKTASERQTGDSAPQTLTPQQQEVYNALQDQLFLERALILTMQELNRSGPKIPPKPGPNATPEEMQAWETEARQKQREIMAALDPIKQATDAVGKRVDTLARTLAPEAFTVHTQGNETTVSVNANTFRRAIGGRFPHENLALPPISASIVIDGPDGYLRISAENGPDGGGINDWKGKP